ncbi:MAG TPA: hypothetical protein VL595_30500 [Pseudonocardia sp.]|nr:hypothetical protein [Pseudonocardia sp.]
MAVALPSAFLPGPPLADDFAPLLSGADFPPALPSEPVPPPPEEESDPETEAADSDTYGIDDPTERTAACAAAGATAGRIPAAATATTSSAAEPMTDPRADERRAARLIGVVMSRWAGEPGGGR